jgi:signal transduction histidine kinase
VAKWRWQQAVAAFALAAAALAIGVTLSAPAHPGWLAVQKADFILGPVLVGLYWQRVRPASRFGLLLIAYGLVATGDIGQSSSASWLSSIGNHWELVTYWATEALILTFPTGRLEGAAARLIMLVAVVGVGMFALVIPPGCSDFSLSGRRALCPENALATISDPSLALDLSDTSRILQLAVALATIVLLVWRMIQGTAPRRRTLAIGAPVSLLFLLAQLSHQGYKLVAPDSHEPRFLTWLIADARCLIWYGFLLALVAAELFAGRVLRVVVGASMRRPSASGLDRMLRKPLGDPGLRFGFWRAGERDFVDAYCALLEPSPGQALTEVDHDGRPAAAIVHDPQLSDDPELLEAAGGVALLALENTELEAARNASLRELAESRARVTEASDRERRKLERDLHDGAQQRLMAIQVKLRLAKERADDDQLAGQLDAIGVDAQEAVEELRTLAHGIYPAVLRTFGLGDALSAYVLKVPNPVIVHDEGVGRCSRSVEGAIYFCAMEAVQNAIKHAGDGAHVTIALGRDTGRVRFAIEDDGVGMPAAASHDGDGLIGMRDRIAAVGGELEIVSAPGAGTIVRGTVPLRDNGDMR